MKNKVFLCLFFELLKIPTINECPKVNKVIKREIACLALKYTKCPFVFTRQLRAPGTIVRVESVGQPIQKGEKNETTTNFAFLEIPGEVNKKFQVRGRSSLGSV